MECVYELAELCTSTLLQYMYLQQCLWSHTFVSAIV